MYLTSYCSALRDNTSRYELARTDNPRDQLGLTQENHIMMTVSIDDFIIESITH